MNTVVNYLIEANAGLLFFGVIYLLLLKNENQFSVNRFYLLGTACFSLLFPLVNFNATSSTSIIPSISQLVPTYWLPEITVYGNASHVKSSPSLLFPIWTILEYTYLIMGSLLMLFFLIRLFRVVGLIRRSKKYSWENCAISETDEDKPTFSFFRFIFIGQASKLSAVEKQEILNHELVHVRKIHSLDILLLNLLEIIFWFNPMVRTYKNELVQLHEFEADARSVRDREVDDYCRLLARVALQSAGFTLVNHFNNSLTIKRITMMKTIKRNISYWKITALVATVPLFFFAVSCQDQLTDVKELNKNSAVAALYPAEVAKELDRMQKANPGLEFVVVQYNEDGKLALKKLKFEDARSGTKFPTMSLVTPDKIRGEDETTYAIIGKSSLVRQYSTLTASDSIYTVVDDQPEYPGGFGAMSDYISSHLEYPSQARTEGKEGKVFVGVVITKEGAVSNLEIIKGVDPLLDKVALDVVAGFPKWKPGRNKGEAVSCKYVLPIYFKLGS
jgi:TonB family protein